MVTRDETWFNGSFFGFFWRHWRSWACSKRMTNSLFGSVSLTVRTYAFFYFIHIHSVYTSHENVMVWWSILPEEVLDRYHHPTFPSSPSLCSLHFDGDWPWKKRRLVRWGYSLENRVEEIHNAFPYLQMRLYVYYTKTNKPFLDKPSNIRMLVDSTIIHYNYRVRCRVWLHIIKKPFNKASKSFSAKRSFDNITMKNSFKRNCRKDRKSRGHQPSI